MVNEKPDPCAWLDRVVAEQAAYYGQTVEQFKRSSSAAADLQDTAEFHGWGA